MAINLYEVTAQTTIAAGTPDTVVAGEPMTGGLASMAGTVGLTPGTWAQPWPVTFLKGQLIALDPSGQLYTAIGAGNLRQVTPAQETGLGIGTSN
ncbi:MAG: hypothetical protein ACRDOK_02650 [Streptosporangiaceae bacterium]